MQENEKRNELVKEILLYQHENQSNWIDQDFTINNGSITQI